MARACALFVLSMLVLACVTINVSSRELLLKGQHDKVCCAACLHRYRTRVSHVGPPGTRSKGFSDCTAYARLLIPYAASCCVRLTNTYNVQNASLYADAVGMSEMNHRRSLTGECPPLPLVMTNRLHTLFYKQLHTCLKTDCAAGWHHVGAYAAAAIAAFAKSIAHLHIVDMYNIAAWLQTFTVTSCTLSTQILTIAYLAIRLL